MIGVGGREGDSPLPYTPRKKVCAFEMSNISTDSQSESKRNAIQRRSTRVPIRVRMDIHGRGSSCDGETVIVNLHGALVKTSEPLTIGDHITLHVSLTGKSVPATVVFADSEDANLFGVELDQPENIWGISLSPEDWDGRPADVDRQR